ncbi:hypothetical protein PsorP6_014040 [Peronosclerospora sorghi]|uniref:Uncharacterized protein n=1 Tax=Peronosclerospora sorghi TaxID=230839 RepID=A0ACC0VHT0_9STRA|nr:hypothetical protein PsorP6_014040 [Peronosclerospora sorghi]
MEEVMAAYKRLKGYVENVPDKVKQIEQTKKALSYLLTHDEPTKEKIEIVEQTVMMEKFNAPGGTKFCSLLNWNPQVDLQDMDCAHGIVLSKTVRVFCFITDGTVEERIAERADRKLYINAAIIQQGRLAQHNQKLSKDELMTIVRFGADKIFNARGSMITDEDIYAILSRGEERPESMKGKIEADMHHSIANFSLWGDNGNASVSSLYKCERELFSKDTNNGDMFPSIFIALPQRERKSNNNEDEYYRTQDPAKIPVVHDHQFSQKERMVSLLTKKTQVENRRKELVRLITEVKADETRVKAPKSKAVEVTETYLVNSLFVHYAHVRSKITSMTLFADIDAATQKIHRICSDATVDAAAVVYLMLSKTVGQCHLIGCH